MFRFQCEWVDGRTTSARSGHELGHMSFAGEEGICTSRGKGPDQAMMICLALVELLDGLRRFLVERQVEYMFVGTDSSFSVQFRRGGKGRIAVRCGTTFLGEAEIAIHGATRFGLRITPHSGHYLNGVSRALSDKVLDIGRQAFARFGITFPP